MCELITLQKDNRNNQGLKRMLFNETRQFNIPMFNKSIFLKKRTKQIQATETNMYNTYLKDNRQRVTVIILYVTVF